MRSNSRRIANILVCVAVFSCTAAIAEEQVDDTLYKKGLAAYKARQYDKAATFFQRSIDEGQLDGAKVWLYAAHAYALSGDKENAADMYKSVIETFADTPEAKNAKSSLEAMQLVDAEEKKEEEEKKELEPFEKTFKEALSAYKAKQFDKASDLFWKSITEGNAGPEPWLYRAHSFYQAGKKKEAVAEYVEITSLFKGQKAAQIATRCLAKVDPHFRWRSNRAAIGREAGGTARKVALSSRIEVIKPTAGHPHVTNLTLSCVKTTLAGLPRNIYKLLQDGGVKVYVGPNIVDRFPDQKNTPKPGDEGILLSEEGGIYGGREISIYERSLVRGTNNLRAPRKLIEIRNNLLREVGRAADDCSGGYSGSEEALKMHKLDVKDMPRHIQAKLSYFTRENAEGSAAACAQLAGYLMGAHSDDKFYLCDRYFRRLKRLVKAKLKL